MPTSQPSSLDEARKSLEDEASASSSAASLSERFSDTDTSSCCTERERESWKSSELPLESRLRKDNLSMKLKKQNNRRKLTFLTIKRSKKKREDLKGTSQLEEYEDGRSNEARENIMKVDQTVDDLTLLKDLKKDREEKARRKDTVSGFTTVESMSRDNDKRKVYGATSDSDNSGKQDKRRNKHGKSFREADERF